MKYNLYSILDKVTCLFSEPFPAVNDGAAIRKFQYLMSQSSMVSGDCSLYLVGAYNQETGVLDSINPQFLQNYIEVKNVEI